MKKKILVFTIFLLGLVGCSIPNSDSEFKSESESNNSTSSMNGPTDVIISSNNETSILDSMQESPSQTLYQVTSKDGIFLDNNGVITITSSGTYLFTGDIANGQIIVNASEDDKVNLNFNNFRIANDKLAPVVINSANKVNISALENSDNYFFDNRAKKEESEEDSSVIGSAIYSACDLSIKGNGNINVFGGYSNGIHTKDDLSISSTTLFVKAYNNCLKGNDEVKINDGNITLISIGGDGIKTSSSKISSKGNQKGNVLILGGEIEIYAAFDGIDSSYNFEMSNNANLKIYTYTYSSYTDTSLNSITSSTLTSQNNFSRPMGGDSDGNNDRTTYSTKGIKTDNEIIINDGVLFIEAYDDALHSNDDVLLENGLNGLGNIVINNGNITLCSHDDAMHADNNLIINDGYINIVKSYEGIEGSYITICGGEIYVIANDDGINAAGKSSPYIKVEGGYIDVSTPNGDTDGIDSNGTYTQTGGFVISRDATSDTSGNASGLDTDDKITINGGTFICVGPSNCTINMASNMYLAKWNGGTSNKGPGGRPGPGSSSSSTTAVSFTSGTYQLTKSNEVLFSFELKTTYKGMWICSDLFSLNSQYELSNGTLTKSWTQSSNQLTSLS